MAGYFTGMENVDARNVGEEKGGRQRKMSWEIVPRFAGPGIIKKTVTIFKDSKGWRLFLPRNIQSKLGDPKHVDLYADGYKLKLEFVQKKGFNTRRLSHGALRLPLKKLGIEVEGGMTRLDVLPEIKENELVIDLEQYREKEI